MNTKYKYNFNAKNTFEQIEKNFNDFCQKNSLSKKVVIGISGGKDSTVAAGLFAKIIGPENVYGVLMPKDVQPDIADSEKVIETTKINALTINIGDAWHSIIESIENNAFDPSEDTKINLGPRLRMSTLYAVAQTVGGIVICTSNLSEITVGYGTFGGDDFGSYAPFKNLTKTEVVKLGDFLGLPEDLVHKTPSDGLCGLTDEDKLGMTYDQLDDFIRNDVGEIEVKQKILEKYKKNKFKTEIVNVPGPNEMHTNFVKWNSNFEY